MLQGDQRWNAYKLSNENFNVIMLTVSQHDGPLAQAIGVGHTLTNYLLTRPQYLV